MRSPNGPSLTPQQRKPGIGWRQPETLRIAQVTSPKGNVLPPEFPIPFLNLQGVWMEQLGFKVGCRVIVSTTRQSITLTLDDTPVPVPYRYQRHESRKAKQQRRRGMLRRWIHAVRSWLT